MNEKRQEKLLDSISQGMSQLFGDKLERVILYGSYARGEADPDSDVDILIGLRGDFDYGALIRQTSELVARLSLDYEVVISRAFISQERFEKEKTPFTLNIHLEGILI
jgi:uncharacterized protein